MKTQSDPSVSTQGQVPNHESDTSNAPPVPPDTLINVLKQAGLKK